MAVRAVDDDRFRQRDAAFGMKVRNREFVMFGAVRALLRGGSGRAEGEHRGEDGAWHAGNVERSRRFVILSERGSLSSRATLSVAKGSRGTPVPTEELSVVKGVPRLRRSAPPLGMTIAGNAPRLRSG